MIPINVRTKGKRRRKMNLEERKKKLEKEKGALRRNSLYIS